MELPYSHSSLCQSNHFSFSLTLGVQGWMLQEASDETCHFILTYSQVHYTVIRMAEVFLIEAKITSEKSGKA
jgi:hypothetical protein